jgi:CRP-like cAMP-binding protein
MPEPHSTTPLTDKLAQLVQLTSKETAVLAEWQAAPRPVPRGRELVSEGRHYGGLLIVIDGVALRYSVLKDGRRQILNIVLPGDFIGFPGCFFENALYSITALTETKVSAVPFAQLFGLFERQPRLAAAVFWLFACEAAMYAEHLVAVGRRSALERVAHFLLELLSRLQAIGRAGERSYQMPLTQELIADALGLTAQHVNRTLRQLREDGLVGIGGQTVTINDFAALAALADFDKSYLSRFHLGALLGAEGGDPPKHAG